MAKKKAELTESLEDYLEVIYNLEQKKKVARVKDIAEGMGVLRGSVTSALKNLAEKGFINYEPYSFVTLTPGGAKIAVEVVRRHDVLKDFLLRVLQLDPETAESNACRMEHAMDRPTIDRLVRFVEFIGKCPRTGDNWIDAFVNYINIDTQDQRKCRKCLDDCLERFKTE